MAVIFVISYNVTLQNKWEMFGERKKVEKKLDKLKNDDSDSENFVELQSDVDDLSKINKVSTLSKGGFRRNK